MPFQCAAMSRGYLFYKMMGGWLMGRRRRRSMFVLSRLSHPHFFLPARQLFEQKAQYISLY
jgi:hypothetical protein